MTKKIDCYLEEVDTLDDVDMDDDVDTELDVETLKQEKLIMVIQQAITRGSLSVVKRTTPGKG